MPNIHEKYENGIKIFPVSKEPTVISEKLDSSFFDDSVDDLFASEDSEEQRIRLAK